MTHFLLQDAVSLSDTIVHKLSADAYSMGFGAFAVEGIPMSGRSCGTFAKRLANYIVALIRKQKREQTTEILHLYEFGAGTGLLAKNMLTHLKRFYPHIYSRIRLHISDLSERSIAEIRDRKILEEHSEVVTFQVMDMCDANYPEDQPPFFIYSTYLFDSLPGRLIKFENDEIFEIQVKTYLPEDTGILNTTDIPPAVLHPEDIKKILQDPDPQARLSLDPFIKRHLIEETISVPLTKSNCSDYEKAELKQLKTTQKWKTPCQFVYSPIATTMIRNLKNLPDATLFISDFGLNKPRNVKVDINQLRSDYGLVVAHGLTFSLIKAIAEEEGLTFHQTKHLSGATQEMVMGNYNQVPLKRTFNRIFKTLGNIDIATIQNKLEQTDNPQKTLSILEEAKKQLSLDDQSDVYYLTMVVQNLINKDLYKEAKPYAKKAVRLYKSISPPALVNSGIIDACQGRYSKAMQYLDSAANIAPYLASIYYVMSYICLQQQKIEAFVQHKMKEIKYTRDSQLKCLYEIGIAMIKLGKTDIGINALKLISIAGEKLTRLSSEELAVIEKSRSLFKN